MPFDDDNNRDSLLNLNEQHTGCVWNGCVALFLDREPTTRTKGTVRPKRGRRQDFQLVYGFGRASMTLNYINIRFYLPICSERNTSPSAQNTRTRPHKRGVPCHQSMLPGTISAVGQSKPPRSKPSQPNQQESK